VSLRSKRQLFRFLYGIALAGMILPLVLGMQRTGSAHAQQAAAFPNPIYLPLVFRGFLPSSYQTLSVNKSGAGSGTITSNPTGIDCGLTCSASFSYGSSVTLSAAASPGSIFGGWSGGGCSGTGACTVIMSSAQSVSAAFNPSGLQILTVIKSGTGSGTVTSNPAGIDCGLTCSASFNYGTSVILSAAAGSGSIFGGWSGGGCSGTGACTVIMSSAQSVSAAFNPSGLQILTVIKSGTGSGTVTSNPAGIDCGSTCSVSFNYGTSVTLSAVASTGSSFSGWSGGGCAGTGTCIISMDTAKSVTATFGLNLYELRVGKSGLGSGTITSSPIGMDCGSTCFYSFPYNTVVTLTATPSYPSVFTGWNEGVCSGTGTCQITMSSNQQVVAGFSIPCSGIANCDFESGRNGQWIEYSAQSYDIIYLCSDPSSCNDVSPHSGVYLGWLGGAINETSYLQQQVSIPSSASFLTYWQWIESDDYCGFNYDYVEILINGTSVGKYDLCTGTSTVEWVPHSIDLSNYVGQSVTLQIRVTTDDTNISNFFIDDVNLLASPLTLGTIRGVSPEKASKVTHGKNRVGTPR
jgi:hypothetical protein